MNSSQKAGKSKSSKTKKGGNFLGAIGDLVAPTGWGSFATAAVLVGMDQADSALRRKKSEKSSAKKGGMRGGTPEKEALIVMQNNLSLTNKFLRLYNHAYTLEDKAASDELRLKLNNLIEKEIKYRKELLQKLTNTDYKPLITNSIIGLMELQKYGNESYNDFMLYYSQMQKIQPNINGSSVNNTLSYLETKYKNKD
jgi:hypothetical protein